MIDPEPPRLSDESAIVVHDLDDAAAVLDAVRILALEGALITPLLVSAPDAAAMLGAAGWIGLIRAARQVEPTVLFHEALDCGDAAGHALEALRLGQRALILDPTTPGADTVAARARVLGASCRARRPAALDLFTVHRPGIAPAGILITALRSRAPIR